MHSTFRPVVAAIALFCLVAPVAKSAPAAPPGAVYHTPAPPYPYQARANKLEGAGICRVTFDASGHVSAAEMFKSTGSNLFDHNTLAWAKERWTGRPNTRVKVPVAYRLR